MAEGAFLDWTIELLEQIETSEEKRLWCQHYSVYSTNSGQEKISRELNRFMNRAYEEGLVISNYRKVILKWGLEERRIATAEPVWLEKQPYLCILACIAWHFRRDHFCEGSLISQSIADGTMLRLLRQLKLVCPSKNPPTPLESVYRFGCKNIPERPGVYWVLCPEGMPIHFVEQKYNCSAPLYPVQRLSCKYMDCANREVLYIGKADNKKGLRQRLGQYMDYGWNHSTNHKSGRAIWQIENAGLLLLAYEECSDAGERKKQLLEEYKAKNGSYPLANWRG